MNKVTAMIARRYSVVCVEGLSVAGVVKNRRLARGLSDVSLGEFRRQLECKTARTGGVLRTVGRWFPSSKTCSNCGVVKAKLPPCLSECLTVTRAARLWAVAWTRPSILGSPGVPRRR